jgi:hypothetical protein
MATATYVPLATQTLGSATASITFSSIPGTYTDLRLVFTGTDGAGGYNVTLKINSDTATNYSYTYILGTGTVATSGASSSLTALRIDTGTSTNANKLFSITDFFSYASVSVNKTVLSQLANDANGSGQVAASVGLWRSTAAITSLTIAIPSTTIAAGATATLWGI